MNHDALINPNADVDVSRHHEDFGYPNPIHSFGLLEAVFQFENHLWDRVASRDLGVEHSFEQVVNDVHVAIKHLLDFQARVASIQTPPGGRRITARGMIEGLVEDSLPGDEDWGMPRPTSLHEELVKLLSEKLLTIPHHVFSPIVDDLMAVVNHHNGMTRGAQ